MSDVDDESSVAFSDEDNQDGGTVKRGVKVIYMYCDPANLIKSLSYFLAAAVEFGRLLKIFFF